MGFKMKREEYGSIFGPTVGDRMHLADTDLIIEIEKDFYEDHYGDETLSGGGKSFPKGGG